MKIAICDDELKDRMNIKQFVYTHQIKHDIIEFNSAIPLLESISKDEHFDVLFLDIEMPDSDGWAVAEQLKKANASIYIAMVTVMDNYIFDCFDRVN
ncbi:MAG: response regulator [Clostridiaceae bacterium]|nr:response regulator [Clostridiaceae bacterium]